MKTIKMNKTIIDTNTINQPIVAIHAADKPALDNKQEQDQLIL
jgi:hypothetical protein